MQQSNIFINQDYHKITALPKLAVPSGSSLFFNRINQAEKILADGTASRPRRQRRSFSMGFSSQKPNQQTDADVVDSQEMEMAGTVLEEYDSEALIRQLAEKERENQELREKNDQLLRRLADMENFKKRLEKEQADLREYANESLLKELLPVVDNLEMALSHGRQQKADPAFLEGVENVLKGFLHALEKFGARPIQALGERFDPTFHNAVMQQEDNSVEDQTIIQELQKGYLLKNRLLRPSMVVVSRQNSASG